MNPPLQSDTSRDAQRVQLELIRGMEPSERVVRTLRWSSQLLCLAKDAIRRRHPEFTDEQVGIKFVELHYGANLAEELRSHLARRRT
jgi:hypothetical protein